MRTVMQTAPASKWTLRAGRILTALAILFLLFDGLGKVMKIAPVMEACAQLDVPERLVPGLGIVLMVATLMYAIPMTSVLGAAVLTLLKPVVSYWMEEPSLELTVIGLALLAGAILDEQLRARGMAALKK